MTFLADWLRALALSSNAAECWSARLITVACLLLTGAFFLVTSFLSYRKPNEPTAGSILSRLPISFDWLDLAVLPRFAKDVKVIISAALTSTFGVLFLAFCVHGWGGNPTSCSTHLLGSFDHVPNFFLALFGTVATISAALLAFFLVAHEYREIRSFEQLADAIDDARFDALQRAGSQIKIRFSILDNGLIFGLLSSREWPRVIGAVRSLWLKDIGCDSTSAIVVLPTQSLLVFLHRSIASTSKNRLAQAIQEIVTEIGTRRKLQNNADLASEFSKCLRDLNRSSDGMISSELRNHIVDLLVKLNESLLREAASMGASIWHSEDIDAEHYLHVGDRACSYFIVPSQNPSAPNLLSGHFTNEQALTRFLTGVIEHYISKAITPVSVTETASGVNIKFQTQQPLAKFRQVRLYRSVSDPSPIAEVDGDNIITSAPDDVPFGFDLRLVLGRAEVQSVMKAVDCRALCVGIQQADSSEECEVRSKPGPYSKTAQETAFDCPVDASQALINRVVDGGAVV